MKQSKRATSVGEVVGQRVTGDPAILDRVSTNVVAREHIACCRDTNIMQETENKPREYSLGGGLAQRKKKWQAKVNKITQIHEAIHLGWNYSSQFIAIKI